MFWSNGIDSKQQFFDKMKPAHAGFPLITVDLFVFRSLLVSYKQFLITLLNKNDK